MMEINEINEGTSQLHENKIKRRNKINQTNFMRACTNPSIVSCDIHIYIFQFIRRVYLDRAV